MKTGAFSRNVGELFSELKLVTDNLLSIYAAANWEATERKHKLYYSPNDGGTVSKWTKKELTPCITVADLEI